MSIFQLVVLALTGTISGLYASSVGGGALLAFPILIILGFTPVHAIATQRLSGLILGLVSSVLFYRHGKLKKLTLIYASCLGILASIGGVVGSRLLANINKEHLNIIIGVLLVIATGAILIKDAMYHEKNEKKLSSTRWILLLLSVFGLGVYGGFFGPGFGVFIIAALTISGFEIIKSAAMGHVIGVLLCATTATLFARQGLINYPAALSLGLGYAVGSTIGLEIALKKNNAFYIKSALVVVVILSLIQLLGS